MSRPEFDSDRAIDRLMRFLAVEGITGEEKAIGAAVESSLLEIGIPRKAVRFDRAHEKILLPTQTGNLIVTLPGTSPGPPGPRLLFSTHLDTVPLGAGAVPVRKGNRIVPQGRTALGGDNRTGVAALVTMLAEIVEQKLPHPPLTVLFTVREESGLWGARMLEPDDLGRPIMGFNIDGRSAKNITIGAVGADRWQVEIFGKASHAGVYPEKGISSTVVAARALTWIHENGWFGKVEQDGRLGTSNVGPVGDADGRCAGQATNVVTDYVKVLGESRSHDTKFFSLITATYRDAFQRAAKEVHDDEGKTARVKFTSRRDYFPFRLKENSLVVQTARAVAASLGWESALTIANGGLDANWLVRHGIPTITFGAGQHEIHTVHEYVDLKEYLEGCQYALALATHVS
jgi:tripeptide aminopeptidase